MTRAGFTALPPAVDIPALVVERLAGVADSVEVDVQAGEPGLPTGSPDRHGQPVFATAEYSA
ncbi:MAG: hypothetical protein ACR2JH_07290 [Solirubrobacteraceae bacterium]